MQRSTLALLLALACLPGPGPAMPVLAAAPPACTATTAGTVACQGGKLCRCGIARGGGLTAGEPGYRWDCGALRPYCRQPRAAGGDWQRPGWPVDVHVPVLPPPRPRPHRARP